MKHTVHVIDVESGNLQSLENAIKHLGEYDVCYIHNAKEFEEAESNIEKLIFPGVGNYGHLISQLDKKDLVKPIRRYIKSGKALMGICVGLQAFFKASEESPEPDLHGLGLLEMNLTKFNSNDPDFVTNKLKKSVPHIGWNSIERILTKGKDFDQEQTLFGINEESKYYFVHSYAAIIDEEKNEVIKRYSEEGWDFAFTRYGSEHFLAAISYGNLFATQFHPEKSGLAGLTVIKNFLDGHKYGQVSLNQPQTRKRDLSGLTKRVIACLDVRTNDDGDLVVTKGDQYNVRESKEGELSNIVRNLGKPVQLANRYYEQGADEITFLNITSFRNSPLKDLPMLHVLREAAKTIFVPLTVGGGIKDMVDPETNSIVPAVKVAELYFRSGADKVSIGSDAVTIAELYYANGCKKNGKSSIEMISSTFGNQAVVISVDPKRKYLNSPSDTTMKSTKIQDPKSFGPNGEQYCYYQVTSQGGRKVHDLGAVELCVACEALGAGEILLNSIDHDGSNKGFNIELLIQVKNHVSIPVIASSGAGNPKHFQEVFELDCGIDAALGAGLFHREEYTVNDVKLYLQQNACMDVRLEKL